MKTPTTLIIMDGYGLAAPSDGNAIFKAETPVLDRLFASCPHTQLSASGEDVGLPAGQIGNSEVGHTNIGAGRVVYQELPKISNAIKTGALFENKAYCGAMDACRDNGGALHLIGLLSPGGVHSHMEHLWGFLKMAKMRGLTKVYIHGFMDGRDVPPSSGKEYVQECVSKCAEIGVGKIATLMGRFYAMDRDNRWDRVEKAYNAMVFGEGAENPDPVDAMQKSYDAGVTDEFVEPVVCDKNGLVKEGDSIIFINFRPDRAREITRTFVDPEFTGFKRKNGYFPVNYVCTTQYDAAMPNVAVAYPPEKLVNTLGQYVSDLGLTQLRIAETEKYAHVTFFFNGGVEEPCKGEDRVLVPSPKEFPTYDLIPQMSADEVAEKACERIRSGKYDLVILNFANCDMVGHTGVFDAAVKAVETVDKCVGQVVKATADMGGVSLITADHGNADSMLAPDGQPHTAHTTNPVPFIVVGAAVKLREGRLADIAPTILDIMGLRKPDEMTGNSLII
jgi:2,3-bisphosphoglycerate-independent phosphoglycerate mutase